MDIGELIGLLFLARDQAHIAHLKSASYAKHMALNTFYDEVIDLADELTECYQGQNGLITIDRLAGDGWDDKTVVGKLKDQLAMIQGGRKQAVGDDTSLQNIVDEIVALYRRTIYKLRYLA